MQVNRLNKSQIAEAIKGKLERHFGCEIKDATQKQLYQAVASVVRDEIMERRTSSREIGRASCRERV